MLLFTSDVALPLCVDQLHLCISSLSFLVLLLPQLCELFLLFEPFEFDRLSMLFSSFFDHKKAFLPIVLGFLQILLILLMLLRSVDQLLLKALLFVLFKDELHRKLFVSVLHLSNLFLIK